MTIAAKLRARRERVHTRKAVAQAIESASTPALRQELLAVTQSHAAGLR